MALYESNYIKLLLLLGELPAGDIDAISRAEDDLPLHLSQCAADATRYTQDLQLTYIFGSDLLPPTDPDLRVRVYRDARMAEVRNWAPHHRHSTLLQLRRAYGRELDRRWSRNQMLGKWLDYLLDKGHGFRHLQNAPVDAVTA